MQHQFEISLSKIAESILDHNFNPVRPAGGPMGVQWGTTTSTRCSPLPRHRACNRGSGPQGVCRGSVEGRMGSEGGGVARGVREPRPLIIPL
eukprot:1254837-Pyramimonas_sp.AAC.1